MTEVIDRQYLSAIYFPEPGGIVFEIATDDPGFTVDEPLLTRGPSLKLRRLAEDVFDEEDIVRRVDELSEFLTAAEAEYGVAAGAWTAVGFSNGADIASAMLLLRPGALDGAVLLAAIAEWLRR